MKLNEKLLLEELLNLVTKVNNALFVPDIKIELESIGRNYSALESKEELWITLDEMCTDVPVVYISLLEYLYEASKDEEILKKELLILTKAIREDRIDMFYVMFYKSQIIRRNFLDYNGGLLFVERSNLHAELTIKMRQFLQLNIEKIDERDRNNNRVVVTINQLLGIKHGPTRNALDYCYTLQKKLHKEVFLFVASDKPVDAKKEYETIGITYSYANYIEALNGYFRLEYLGENIKGYQCKINTDNKEEVKNIILNIYGWKPYLIYNIGTDNIVADLCGTFTQEVTIPCAYSYPITEAEFYILPRNIKESDKAILDYIQQKNRRVIESIFVYKLEEPVRRYKKTEFGFKEDALVIAVVGNRLSNEVNEDFIEVLQKILKTNPSVYIVFIGNFNDFDEKQKIIGYEDRIKYIGFQNDLRGVLNIADLYLNPPRKGGGTSAVEAMAEGIPVITLGNCDVAYACGDEFLCRSLPEMPELVNRYICDREFYNSQSNKALLQAERVVKTEDVLRDILLTIE